MLTNKSLPTIFATTIGESSKILIKHEMGMNHVDYSQRIERMRAFQQMAITGSFEEAMIAFYEYDLTDEQKTALEVIYKSTNIWITGHVVGALLDDMNENAMSNEKARAEAAKIIFDQLSNESSKSDGKRSSQGLTVVMKRKMKDDKK